MKYVEPNTKEVAAAAIQLWQEVLFKFPDGPTPAMMEAIACLCAVACKEASEFMVTCSAPKHLANIDAVYNALANSQRVYITAYKEFKG